MKHLVTLLALSSVLFAARAFGHAAADAPPDAVALYLKAAGDGFTVQGPGESPLAYADYPPYPPEWHKLAKASREANADRLALARQARSAPPGAWPGPVDTRTINALRALTEELADAGLYEHVQGNHAEAVEFERDVLALGRSLRTAKEANPMQVAVATGIEAVAADRLMVMAPGLVFAKDKADGRNISPDVIRDLIKQLLTPRDVKVEVSAAAKVEPAALKPGERLFPAESLDRMLKGSCAEQRMLAMSLACQLYRNQAGRWPGAAADLVPLYLPSLPIDPFGKGEETIGYVVIKDGLPGRGGGRPLVYSRQDSEDGLYFRLDEPFYSRYNVGSIYLPQADRKHGGQFRDVARWAPVKRAADAPRIRKLETPS